MNNQTFPQFGNYVCHGDTITWSKEGFDFVARLEHDYSATPYDFECYAPKDLQRWKNDEWFFGGLILSVSRNGVELSEHAAGLWGIDCNFGKDNSYLSEVACELEHEALGVARAELAQLRGLLVEDDHGLTHADRAQFYGPSVRI
jgi:hypothetical protein